MPLSYKNEKKLAEIRSTFERFGVAVYADHVVICGQIVHRPSGVSPSQWLGHWEITQ